jgi:hypothetical protein
MVELQRIAMWIFTGPLTQGLKMLLQLSFLPIAMPRCSFSQPMR